MKSILIVSFALLAFLIVLASCENTITTKLSSKDSLVLESTNNEDTIEFMFKNAEHYPLIGVKVIRQTPVSTNSSSQQSSGQASSQSQQSSDQSQSQTVQPQSSSGQMQQEQANTTIISQQQQQQQSNATSQASNQQSSQSSNQTQAVEKQENPQAQSSSQAGNQGSSSSSQASTPQSGNQNSTASSTSGATSSQQGSGATSQSTAQQGSSSAQSGSQSGSQGSQSGSQSSSSATQPTPQSSPVSQDNSSISGDHAMDLTPNNTQSSQPIDNSTSIVTVNTTLINETLQSIGINNATSKDVNITDIIGRIISGENITEILNETLRNFTQWLNSTLDGSNESSQQSKRSLHRRLLSLIEPNNEENEDYAQYIKFTKLKLLSKSGEIIKDIPLSDSNINWNYGHSILVNNEEQPFKVPHVDVEIPLSTQSSRPTLKIRTMMTEATSHYERNGRDVQLTPKSMDIQISLDNLHDLLSEQEKKLSDTTWEIETEMSSTTNSLHLMQTKKLNGIQKVVVMGNNFIQKGQFTFDATPRMKVIQNSENDALISIQVRDSSNSFQLNPIKFGVQ